MTTEELTGVPIMLALLAGTWALWRGTLREPEWEHKWPAGLMALTWSGLTVACGWYWVGLFTHKI